MFVIDTRDITNGKIFWRALIFLANETQTKSKIKLILKESVSIATRFKKMNSEDQAVAEIVKSFR